MLKSSGGNIIGFKSYQTFHDENVVGRGIEPWSPAWKAIALSMQPHEHNRRVDTI